jgi:CubicO group peptidase (beta-lactamase class C family)
MKVSNLALPLIMLSAALSFAQADQIDDYVRAEMKQRHIPAVSIAIIEKGKPPRFAGYGMANEEANLHTTPQTVYQLASVTKQFTATAIMLLADEGKLTLEDKVRKHLPNLPEAWDAVTVKQLLNHSSGIKSYTSLGNMTQDNRRDVPPSEIIDRVKALPLEFEPGARFSYNNTGYHLLGMLIEKISGKTYGEFLNERIFARLGMSSTRVNDSQAVIPQRASGYMWRDGKLQNCFFISPTVPYSAGAIISTVEDMAKWDAALRDGSILKKETLESMWQPTRLSSGKIEEYGYGWSTGKSGVGRVVGHGGGILGFSTQIDRYVDAGLTVVVLCNLESGNAGSIAAGIAKIVDPRLTPKVEPALADQEPKVTELLRKVITGIMAGNADQSDFTPQARAAFFPNAAKAAREDLNGMGPLKSLVLVEKMKLGADQRYRYRTVFGSTGMKIIVVITPEGKIVGLGAQPE